MQVSIIHKKDPILSSQKIDKIILMIIREMIRESAILFLEAKKRLWT